MERQNRTAYEPRYEKRRSSRSTASNTPMPRKQHDFGREAHREQARQLKIKGLIGFAGGFLFALITMISDGDFSLAFPFVLGFFLAGIPYGWEVLGKLFGHWYAFSIPIMIVLFILQLVGAIIIGWVAYPIALLYNLMKAQHPGSIAEKIYKICLILFVLLVAAFIIFACMPR